MANNGSAGRTQAKSARRALDLLEVLADERDGQTFGELGRRLELPKSSLHELLDVLAKRSYVAIDPESRRYSLGVRVWELGQAFARYRELVAEALPIMDGIVQALNETVQLSVLDGVDNVYLAKVDCTHAVRLQSHVGKRLPAYATGLGKALLASLPAEERRERLTGLTFTGFTASTLLDATRLEQELMATQRRGFAFDDQEYTPGLRCVAVPIGDASGRTVASMSASIPIMRAESSRLANALQLLAEGSLAISRRLGGRGDDPVLLGLAGGSESELVVAITTAARRTGPVASSSSASDARRG